MVSGLQLASELGRGEYGGVDFPPQDRLGRGKRRNDVRERGVPNDQNVDVALGALATFRDRPEKEREPDALGESGEGRSKHVGGPGRLDDQPLDLGEHGAARIRLVIDLATAHASTKETRRREARELALRRPQSAPGGPSDFPDVESPSGPAEEHGQHGAAALSEKRGGDSPVGARCTHCVYICTRYGYVR